METFVTWLEQSWVILVAVIGGITLVWNFYNKTVKEIKAAIVSPLQEVKDEVKGIEAIISQKEKEDSCVVNALQSMQRRFLLDGFTKVLNEGSITINERETLSRQVDSYIELGGNSFIRDMWKEVCELPIKNIKIK